MRISKSRTFGSLAVAAACWCLSGATAVAQDTIVGVWWSPKKDAKIEITEKGGVYTGRIIAGVDRLDAKNADRRLRGRHLVGATLMKDMEADGEKWSGGTFYDPDGGTTYKCKMWLDGPDKLMMRGFIGVSLVGRTETCVKVAGPNPRSPQPGEPAMTYLEPAR